MLWWDLFFISKHINNYNRWIPTNKTRPVIVFEMKQIKSAVQENIKIIEKIDYLSEFSYTKIIF